MAATPTTAKGFIGSLFDFSFSSLITTRVIKVVYVIATVLISLVAVAYFIGGLAALGSGSAAVGLGLVVGAPLGWLLYMIVARLSLELAIVIFRIGDDVRRMADAAAGPAGHAAGYPPSVPGYGPPVGGYGPPPGGYQPPPTGGYPPPPVG
jgi:hypothetical protein